MATLCRKCGGVIPDIQIDYGFENSCKNHIKQEVNIFNNSLLEKEK